MTKKDITDIVANRTGIAAQYVGIVIDEVCEQIKESVLNGEKVSINGFGRFYLRKYKSMPARDIYRDTQITLNDYKKIAFRMSMKLKKDINK